MLMAYDEHWATGAPGAIAGQDWFDATLKKRMAELSPGAMESRLCRSD
jgi:spore germination protein YaaH